MQTMSISAAKAHLNELVDQAVATQEHFTITKNGTPAAVVVSAQEWESIQETLFWQAQPGIVQDVAEARAAYADGATISVDELLRRGGPRA
jgi:antitoxin YefM